MRSNVLVVASVLKVVVTRYRTDRVFHVHACTCINIILFCHIGVGLFTRPRHGSSCRSSAEAKATRLTD